MSGFPGCEAYMHCSGCSSRDVGVVEQASLKETGLKELTE